MLQSRFLVFARNFVFSYFVGGAVQSVHISGRVRHLARIFWSSCKIHNWDPSESERTYGVYSWASHWVIVQWEQVTVLPPA